MVKYFVSTTGSDTANNGLSSTTAFATLGKAVSLLANGDEIEVAGGSYAAVGTIAITGKNNFKIYAGAGQVPSLNFTDAADNGLDIRNCNNFEIKFLELAGNAENLTYQEAYDARFAYNAKFASNGISVRNSYKFLIQGCSIQDFPGAGIGITECDYSHVDRCKVKRCTKYSPYGTQAITFHYAFNSPGAVANAERMKATNNVCYDNYNLIPWTLGGGNGQLNEGAGLYSDTTKRDQASVAYTGTTRFEQNLLALNGAAGIHALQACPIVLRNNFCAGNQRNLTNGEIQLNSIPSATVTGNYFATTSASLVFAKVFSVPALTLTGNTIEGTTSPTYANNNYNESLP